MFAISDNFKRLYPFVAFVTVPDQLNARSGINKKVLFLFVSISNFLDKYACRQTDRQTQRALRKQNEIVFQSYGRPIA